MQVTGRRILTLAVWRDEALGTPYSVDRVKVRQIIDVRLAHLHRYSCELVCNSMGFVGAIRHLDGTMVSMKTLLVFAVVRLVLLQVRNQVSGRSTRGVPCVPVGSLGSTVCHHVRRRAASQDAPGGHEKHLVCHLWCCLAHVETVGLGVR